MPWTRQPKQDRPRQPRANMPTVRVPRPPPPQKPPKGHMNSVLDNYKEHWPLLNGQHDDWMPKRTS